MLQLGSSTRPWGQQKTATPAHVKFLSDFLYFLSRFILQVVGGMTWCIQTCNFDIDVDLLFQENSSIGQKM